jgi:hypothetical protein
VCRQQPTVSLSLNDTFNKAFEHAGKGAFKDIFNRHGSGAAGCIWLAEPDDGDRDYARCQRFGFAEQISYNRNTAVPTVYVRR